MVLLKSSKINKKMPLRTDCLGTFAYREKELKLNMNRFWFLRDPSMNKQPKQNVSRTSYEFIK